MPYTVLKISKIITDQVEVAGEFPDEKEARKFVEAELVDAEINGTRQDHDYLVEAPPTMIQ